MRIGVGEIGMRMRQPRRLDQSHRTSDLMRLALIFAGQHRRRHQGRRQFDRFNHALARQIPVDIFQFQRARRQEHAALPAIGFLVDQARSEIVIEDSKRAAPVAPGAAKSKHGMRGPGR